MRTKLYRSRNGGIAGVCQGLAEWSGLSTTLIRLTFLIAFFCFGSGLGLYIILAIIIPKEPNGQYHYHYHSGRDYDNARDNYAENRWRERQRTYASTKESNWDSRFHRY